MELELSLPRKNCVSEQSPVKIEFWFHVVILYEN